jgi:HNH endonuclease
MFSPGDVISYLEMCSAEGTNLQRGMNFNLSDGQSILLMSLKNNAPYADRVLDEGRILIYEGHDAPKNTTNKIPKLIDQPKYNPGGSLTQNGLFFRVAMKHKNGEICAERVKVYEKIYRGIWVYNGLFNLVDAWQETSGSRQVFKFKLELSEVSADNYTTSGDDKPEISHDRIIPSKVKLEVWKRDNGRCVKCGSQVNLHFDHIIPFSKGGSSLVAENIQLLCARHNLQKKDNIE